MSSGDLRELVKGGDTQAVLPGLYQPSSLDPKSDEFWADVFGFQEGTHLLGSD